MNNLTNNPRNRSNRNHKNRSNNRNNNRILNPNAVTKDKWPAMKKEYESSPNRIWDEEYEYLKRKENAKTITSEETVRFKTGKQINGYLTEINKDLEPASNTRGKDYKEFSAEEFFAREKYVASSPNLLEWEEYQALKNKKDKTPQDEVKVSLGEGAYRKLMQCQDKMEAKNLKLAYAHKGRKRSGNKNKHQDKMEAKVPTNEEYQALKNKRKEGWLEGEEYTRFKVGRLLYDSKDTKPTLNKKSEFKQLDLVSKSYKELGTMERERKSLPKYLRGGKYYELKDKRFNETATHAERISLQDSEIIHHELKQIWLERNRKHPRHGWDLENTINDIRKQCTHNITLKRSEVVKLDYAPKQLEFYRLKLKRIRKRLRTLNKRELRIRKPKLKLKRIRKRLRKLNKRKLRTRKRLRVLNKRRLNKLKRMRKPKFNVSKRKHKSKFNVSKRDSRLYWKKRELKRLKRTRLEPYTVDWWRWKLLKGKRWRRVKRLSRKRVRRNKKIKSYYLQFNGSQIVRKSIERKHKRKKLSLFERRLETWTWWPRYGWRKRNLKTVNIIWNTFWIRQLGRNEWGSMKRSSVFASIKWLGCWRYGAPKVNTTTHPWWKNIKKRDMKYWKKHAPVEIDGKMRRNQHEIKTHMRSRIWKLRKALKVKSNWVDRKVRFAKHKWQQIAGRRHYLRDRVKARFRQTLKVLYKKIGKTHITEYVIQNIKKSDIYFLNKESSGYLTRNFDNLVRDTSVLCNNITYALISMLMPRGFKTVKRKRAKKKLRRPLGLRNKRWLLYKPSYLRKRFRKRLNPKWWNLKNRVNRRKKSFISWRRELRRRKRKPRKKHLPWWAKRERRKLKVLRLRSKSKKKVKVIKPKPKKLTVKVLKRQKMVASYLIRKSKSPKPFNVRKKKKMIKKLMFKKTKVIKKKKVVKKVRKLPRINVSHFIRSNNDENRLKNKAIKGVSEQLFTGGQLWIGPDSHMHSTNPSENIIPWLTPKQYKRFAESFKRVSTRVRYRSTLIPFSEFLKRLVPPYKGKFWRRKIKQLESVSSTQHMKFFPRLGKNMAVLRRRLWRLRDRASLKKLGSGIIIRKSLINRRRKLKGLRLSSKPKEKVKRKTKKNIIEKRQKLYLFKVAKMLLKKLPKHKRLLLPLVLKIRALGFIHIKPYVLKKLQERLFKKTGIVIKPQLVQKLTIKLRKIVPLMPITIHNHIFESMRSPTKLRIRPSIGRNKNVLKQRSGHILEQRLANMPAQLFKTEQFKSTRFNFSSLATNDSLYFQDSAVRIKNEMALISIFQYIRRPQYYKVRFPSRRKKRAKRRRTRRFRAVRWLLARPGKRKFTMPEYKKWRLYKTLSKWRPKWRFKWYGVRRNKRWQRLYLLRFQLQSFLRKHNIEIPYIKMIAPMTSSQAIRRIRTRRKLYTLRKIRRKTNYFDNTLKIIYLTGKFKNPTIVSEHFAREICLNRKHSQTINMLKRLFEMLKLYAGKPTSLINVGIFGKINWSDRTRFRTVELGEFMPTRRNFSAGLKYGFAPADARTGSFGIRVALQNNNHLVRHLKHAVPHWAKFSLFPQRRLPTSRDARLFKKKVSGILARTSIATHQPVYTKTHYWNTLSGKVNEHIWMGRTRFEEKRRSYYEVSENPDLRTLLRSIFGVSFSKWLS